MEYAPNKIKQRMQQKLKQKRENNFDMSFRNERLPEYNALHDTNLRHFFENKHVQGHLYTNGLIDANGRVINLEKNKSKLFIIEQEFKAAEKEEQWRRKEEEEMRYRVQQKRHETLEKARREERLLKIKADRQIRQQILSASRSIVCGTSHTPKIKKKKKKKSQKQKKSAASRSLESSKSFFVHDDEPEVVSP